MGKTWKEDKRGRFDDDDDAPAWRGDRKQAARDKAARLAFERGEEPRRGKQA